MRPIHKYNTQVKSSKKSNVGVSPSNTTSNINILVLLEFAQWLVASNISICFCCLYGKIGCPFGQKMPKCWV